jgi:hypothetical protein
MGRASNNKFGDAGERMATRLLPYDIGCEPSPSIPAETLLQDGWKTYLLFFAVSKSIDASGFLKDLGVAVLECQECVMSKFGYPNDEGLPERPLYGCGMADAPPAVLEVVDSQWAKEVVGLMAASARRIWDWRGVNSGLAAERAPRHFIIKLKEATFECLASSLSVVRYCKTSDETFAHVIERFKEGP